MLMPDERIFVPIIRGMEMPISDQRWRDRRHRRPRTAMSSNNYVVIMLAAAYLNGPMRRCFTISSKYRRARRIVAFVFTLCLFIIATRLKSELDRAASSPASDLRFQKMLRHAIWFTTIASSIASKLSASGAYCR